MKREEFLQSKMILLTPLLTFDTIFDSILHSNHEGILVMGIKIINTMQIKLISYIKQIYRLKLSKCKSFCKCWGYETENSIEAIAKIIGKLKEVVRTN